MATWTKSKPACVVTWITLAIMDQSTRAFPNSGTVKMRKLAFWGGASTSPAVRKARARATAVQMDNIFRDLAGSKYENGVRKSKAIVTMIDALLKGDDTMADLAEVNDGLYKFLGE